MGRRVVGSSSRSKNKNRGGQGRGGRATAAAAGGTGGGVLTRAKSLALYGVTTTSSSLDLRTRRLEKIDISKRKHRPHHHHHPPKPTNPSSLKVSTPPLPPAADGTAPGDNAPPPPPPAAASDDARTTRESTPCNLIRDSSILSAPGSSNKHTSKSTAQQTGGPSCQRVIPSEREINDLFGKPEELQQKNFTEKYNFDPVTEQPLPGRYEWEKLDPPK